MLFVGIVAGWDAIKIAKSEEKATFSMTHASATFLADKFNLKI
jgi:hypothetical protein